MRSLRFILVFDEKTMNKRLLPLLVLLELVLPAAAQQQEVIHLKNGSVIRNIAEMQHADSLIRVRTADGSVFVFGPGDLARMGYERRPSRYKTSGYLLDIEWGVLSGRQSPRWQFGPAREAVNSFSFSVVNGYRFNRLVGVGVGVGLDAYREGVITPLFVRASGHLFNARFSPVYALDAGYGFYSPVFNDLPGGDNSVAYRFRGGLMGNAAGGVQVFLGRDIALYTMLGYRVQQARFAYSSDVLESREVEQLLFRRLSLRLGFSF
ncbi:MAG: hypothetical protein AVDCRST_MAG56-4647 [uncultured Cytophagales bacterium]|uniref:Outer membrane protein beta-barrel domain-containing protein n=1 Tax=uncultured Cytophagales bacterium TaxID=158755 RepID=A0A6J4JZN1_9SPHI|nr:MAG: hypothetical protein AVDCRST_MAG56-4647 [uncultured Cytophagales bacterium]